MVNLWVKEHQRHVRLIHAISITAEHNIETGHQILFDKTTTTANITSYFLRKYREARSIEVQKYPNLNRDNGYNINKIWKTILPVIEDGPISSTSPPTHNSFHSSHHSNK